MSTISATDTEVATPVNFSYNDMLLENARPNCPYFAGTTQGILHEHAGTASMKWRRYSTDADPAATGGTQISPTVSALAELQTTASYLQGRSADTVSYTDYTATIAKYGQYYILNEEVDLFNPNGTAAGIVRSLAISAGRSLNQLQRDIVDAGTDIRYANGVANDAAVVAKISTADINYCVNTMMVNSAMTFSPMSVGSQNVGSNPMLPAFWGACHPHVAYDIANLTGFKSVETYAGQVDTVPGEIGSYGLAGATVRFIQTPDADVNVSLGGAPSGMRSTNTTDTDLYNVSIWGEGAIGSVGLGEAYSDGIYRAGDNPSPIELIAHGRGSVGGDAFDEISTIAWKAWHVGKILNPNWTQTIRCTATDLGN